MLKINPYLSFSGNSEEAFNFYKTVFGGEFLMLQRFKDTPESEKISEKDKDKIMHISLPIGNANILMASDVLPSMGFTLTSGNNFQLSIDTESKEEADNIFNKLSAGGNIELPMQDMFWGSYFGMLKDKFGIKWMVSYTLKK